MVPNLDALTAVLFRLESIYVMVGVWAIMGMVGKVFPNLYQHSTYARFLPVLPILLAEGCVWLPGIAPEGSAFGPRMLLGIVLGVASGQAHKMLKQTLLGNDDRVRTKRKSKPLE